MAKKKILITAQIPQAGIDLLSDYHVDIFNQNRSISKDELLKKSCDCHAIISMLSDPIDKDIFNNAPNLKVVANYAVGYDNIDIIEATQRGIAVGNTPNTLTETTAELALALMISVARKISTSHQSVQQGRWERWAPMGFLGKDLRGKTLGIVGMGAIGQALAKNCHFGFGMKIIYHSRNEKKDIEKSLSAQKVSFDQLLKESDFISVHTNLNSSTKKLFNKDAFDKTEKCPIFINTARGQIHDEKALLEAIKNKQIWGAGLDVTDPEPMNKNNPLLQCDNVIITPHIGSATLETRSKMSVMAAQNIIAGLEKKILPGFVNPEVYK